MTILLYDYHELEERASKNLSVWKAWHTTLYILAAVLGIVNYTFLLETKQLVDDNCVFDPRQLEFHWVEIPQNVNHGNTSGNITQSVADKTNVTEIEEVKSQADKTNVTGKEEEKNEKDIAQTTAAVPTDKVSDGDEAKTVKRNAPGKETKTEFVINSNETTIEDNDATVIRVLTVNSTHRLMLDTSRTLFARDGCDFAEYMPLLSTVFASVWATLFIMCPGGGRTTSTSGLQQSWRILAPALMFAIVLVGLTGHSFTTTNAGLQAFCAAFHNYSDATTCSSVSPFVERAWNASLGMGALASATRAAAAGAWACWACAAALLLARCLAAPDFQLRHTEVHLKDPHQKIIPHLTKGQLNSKRSKLSSPTEIDTASIKSEPTATTELVTASIEQGPDSAPTSLTATPERTPRRREEIEMTCSPRELEDRR